MKLTLLSILLALVLFGCRPTAPTDNTAMLEATEVQEVIEEVDSTRLALDVNGVELRVKRPNEWEYYTTEYGVVLAEQLGSVAAAGELGGLFTHVWVPPLEDFVLPVNAQNEALAILNEIIANPDYVGNARVSSPSAFTWDGAEAAYYLMDNDEGNLTIVFGIVVPGVDRFVAASISASVDDIDRIRSQIPSILDELTVDGVTLSGESLEQHLPEELALSNN